MKQLEFFKVLKQLKEGSFTYKAAKERLDNKLNWQNLYILDRSGTRLNREHGYIGMDFWHSKGFIRWYPNGRVKVDLSSHSKVSAIRNHDRRNSMFVRAPVGSIGVNVSWCITERLNKYLPFLWHFYTFRHHLMVVPYEPGKDIDFNLGFEVPMELWFDKDGKIDPCTPLGKSHAVIDAHYRREYKRRDKRRRRGRYWLRRARNLYVDRSKCVNFNQKNLSRRDRYRNCERLLRWPRVTVPTQFKCGCRTYRKQMQFRIPVHKIINEPNATVRTAMIKLYGVARFFEDANAKEIDSRGNYRLLRLRFRGPIINLGTNNFEDNQRSRMNLIHALKMVCPSTGEVYVNIVPNIIHKVEPALDWIYQVQNYFSTIGKET